jgi:hypothetical protein
MNASTLATAELTYRSIPKADRLGRNTTFDYAGVVDAAGEPTVLTWTALEIPSEISSLGGAALRDMAGALAAHVTTQVEARMQARKEAPASKPVPSSRSKRPAASPVRSTKPATAAEILGTNGPILERLIAAQKALRAAGMSTDEVNAKILALTPPAPKASAPRMEISATGRKQVLAETITAARSGSERIPRWLSAAAKSADGRYAKKA